jgi:inner membrane protein
MDILTQIVLGSSVAPFLLPKEEPRKAMIAGGVLGAVPDLDMILGIYVNEYQELILHRSFSHAIIPFLALSFVLLWFSKKLKIFPESSSVRQFTAFFIFLFTHALLDCFTTWGTQLFWPLSGRIATQSVFVVDLIYSVPLGLSVLAYFLFFKNGKALGLLRLTLLFTTFYIVILFVYQQTLKHNFVERHQINDVLRVNAQPGLFRPFQYRLVIEKSGHFLVSRGVHSLLDDKQPEFFVLPKNTHISDFTGFDLSELRILSRGYLSMKRASPDSIVINDLRYGPQNPDADEYQSAFTYYLVREKGEWQFRQNMRTIKKLSVLWEKILYESGIGDFDPQGR